MSHHCQSRRAAVRSLKYRDTLTIALVVNRDQVVPDNWINIHDLP